MGLYSFIPISSKVWNFVSNLRYKDDSCSRQQVPGLEWLEKTVFLKHMNQLGIKDGWEGFQAEGTAGAKASRYEKVQHIMPS